MLFTDTLFLFLLGMLWVTTQALRKWPVCKEWVIIAFGIILIATWGAYSLIIFGLVLIFNHIGAHVIYSYARQKNRWAQGILAGVVTIDVAALAFFKYRDFFSANWQVVSGSALPVFSLGIPLAISFYTFHIISYLIDVYHLKLQPLNWRPYLFYLSFFPHLISGPIVRVWQLVPQIGKVRGTTRDLMFGLHYLIVGFFLKAVVANNIANLIDPFAPLTHELSTVDHWSLAILFYGQIYGDFAGYTLMALGMARLFGYRLPVNFRRPIFAMGLQDFWRRWHITLSHWLRDYLYIPLGGNRGGSWRVYCNLMVTMLLGGLWHGAGWGFVIWGALHGAGLALQRGCGRSYEQIFARYNMINSTGINKCPSWIDGISRVLFFWVPTQMLVVVAWVFFRSENVHAALAKVQSMFGVQTFGSTHVHLQFFAYMIFLLPIAFHHLVPAIIQKIGRKNLYLFMGVTTVAMLLCNILIFSPVKNFIYFKF